MRRKRSLRRVEITEAVVTVKSISWLHTKWQSSDLESGSCIIAPSSMLNVSLSARGAKSRRRRLLKFANLILSGESLEPYARGKGCSVSFLVIKEMPRMMSGSCAIRCSVSPFSKYSTNARQEGNVVEERK